MYSSFGAVECNYALGIRKCKNCGVHNGNVVKDTVEALQF